MKSIEYLLLAVLGGVGIWCALGIEEPAFSLQKDYLGVSGYPLLVGLLLAGVCLLRILCGAFLSAAGAVQPADERPWAVLPVLVAAAYVAGISSVGFLLCTFCYLGLMPFLLDRQSGLRGWWKNLVYALAVSAVLFAFFRLFKIYLPDTILF